MRLNDFIAAITPKLKQYRMPLVARGECSLVCGAVRFAAHKMRVEMRIGAVTIKGTGHNVLYSGQEIIDFTLSQFMDEAFPFRCLIGSEEYKRVYGSKRAFMSSDNDWDWMDDDFKLTRTLIAAAKKRRHKCHKQQ